MKYTDLPSPHIPLLFTDRDAIQHRGVYNDVLNAFIEKMDTEFAEETGISYPPDKIAAWEYQDDQETSDPDILEIL